MHQIIKNKRNRHLNESTIFETNYYKMKKHILFLSLISFFTITSFSQATKPKPVVKPTIPAVVLKTAKDSASYAMGVFIVSVYIQQGITNINSNLVARAIDDIQNKQPRKLDDAQANTAVMNYLTKIQSEKSQPTISAGEKFLAENKKRPGVQTTASGLQYEIIAAGTGIIPVNGDTVVCDYKGTLLDGTEVDNSYTKGVPLTISVNRLITGWTEALLMMPVGSKWKLYIPYNLGYGPADYYAIPGGSLLIFEMELLNVLKK